MTSGSRRAARWLSGAFVVALLVAGAAGARVTTAPEGERASVLVAIAATFNQDYSANRVGAVYDRFDVPSRAVISRADYVRRHLECPDPPGPASILGAARSRGGYWLVRYSIGGVVLTDYWHYVAGRWAFSLVRSNPDAVALYRMPFAEYERALGCTPAG